jgi:putative ABC transport system permease protein
MMTVRVALRSLARSPGFAAATVITFMIGIGAISAMFSVINTVLLKPLAGVDTDRIVKLSEQFPAGAAYTRPRTFREWRELSDLFDAIGGRTYCSPNLSGIGEPEQLTGACVTANWFDVYRAHAILGRTFLADEDRPGREHVTVLDYGFGQRHFGGDQSIIGRKITLDQKPYVVVGVMPKEFLPLGKGGADLYLPRVLEANELTSLEVTARLRDGVTIDRTRAALGVDEARLSAANPADYRGVTAEVALLRETIIGPSRDLLWLLMAASALVLLIACVNTANLFLARAVAKGRETQIRAALGANRLQLIAPVLAESAIVSSAGGGLGLLAAGAIVRLLALRLDNFPRAQEIVVDFRVALFTLGISIIAVFVCGIAPALLRRQAAKNALVIAEVALTFVLLICSGLLMRSFAAMRQVDLGYNPQGAIFGFVSQPADLGDQRDAAVALWRSVRQRITTLPGVGSVATTTATPPH